jgi:hypothetical protein
VSPASLVPVPKVPRRGVQRTCGVRTRSDFPPGLHLRGERRGHRGRACRVGHRVPGRTVGVPDQIALVPEMRRVDVGSAGSGMSGIYLASGVLGQLTEAQVVIDMHVALSRLGRCGLCEEVEPCAMREKAQALLVRYGRLPRRTPGLTLTDTSPWTVGGWFDTARPAVRADVNDETRAPYTRWPS